MPRFTSIACLTAALSAAAVYCAPQTQDSPKLSGFTAVSEGGVEGTQSVLYDNSRKVIGGNAVPPSGLIFSNQSAPPPVLPNIANSKSVENSSAPLSQNGSLPNKKMVDSSVDFNSGLKKASKGSDILDQRFDMKQAELNKDKPYSRDNVVTFDTWQGKYDTLGRKKAEMDVEATFDRGELRDKTMFEVKAFDRPEVVMSGQRAEIKGLDERLTTEKSSRYDVTPQSPSDRLAPKSIDQLSMQDINRYQFRRNRSEEPGLPYVKPGSDEVKMRGGAGQ